MYDVLSINQTVSDTSSIFINYDYKMQKFITSFNTFKYQKLFPYTDMTSTIYWQSHCDITNLYYKFLIQMYVKYNDTSINLSR